jgi:prepilin-type N-terminal cleavage/methylation domain-containing protein
MGNTVTKQSNCGRRREARGFTLIELMIVVAIVGVLSTIGLVSYHRFVTSAKTSEAIGMVGSIRAAEESYRAETLSYLDVSAGFSKYYPDGNVGAKKTAWDTPAHSDYVRWRQLGARSDGPVYYGYKVAAGTAGGTIPALNLVSPPTFAAPTEPWYVIEAVGDVDGNGVTSHVAGSSYTGEIYVENEGE